MSSAASLSSHWRNVCAAALSSAHDQRYEVTREFLDVYRDLLAGDSPQVRYFSTVSAATSIP
ncbi:hypothetical protein, partial [Halomonas sp. 707D7]|uniref:hypothetical protein n=1 Tax=Halomonas sp. 707D7 TaxID=1681044 RepID=UPI00209E6DA8